MPPKASPAKRTASQAKLAAGGRYLLHDAVSQDRVFIDSELDASPGLVTGLASLLRAGTIAKLLSGEWDEPASSVVGAVMLAVSSRKWRAVKATKQLLLLLHALEPVIFRSVDPGEYSAPLTAIFGDLLRFALGVGPSSTLPSQFRNFRDFSVLGPLCKARYRQLGSMLRTFQKPSMEFGFFKHCPAVDPRCFECTVLANQDGIPLQFLVTLPSDVMTNLEGWSLKDNGTADAKIMTVGGLDIRMWSALAGTHPLAVCPDSVDGTSWDIDGFELEGEDALPAVPAAVARAPAIRTVVAAVPLAALAVAPAVIRAVAPAPADEDDAMDGEGGVEGVVVPS